MPARPVIDAATGLGAGAVLGAAFLLALRANARLYLDSPVAAVALHVARLSGAAIAFLALAIVRPASLLPALLGFTACALVASRRASAEKVAP